MTQIALEQVSDAPYPMEFIHALQSGIAAQRLIIAERDATIATLQQTVEHERKFKLRAFNRVQELRVQLNAARESRKRLVFSFRALRWLVNDTRVRLTKAALRGGTAEQGRKTAERDAATLRATLLEARPKIESRAVNAEENGWTDIANEHYRVLNLIDKALAQGSPQ